MESGFFRSKEGYTVVQNNIVRDKTVSLKAKGLYLLIQSYITMPDKKWSKTDFFNRVKEGEKAFETAWNELKNHGYLKVHMYSYGFKFRIEYDLLYEAEEGPHTFYYTADGKLSSTNIDRKKKKEMADRKNDMKILEYGSADQNERSDYDDSDDEEIINVEVVTDFPASVDANQAEDTYIPQKVGNIYDPNAYTIQNVGNMCAEETCTLQNEGNMSTCYPHYDIYGNCIYANGDNNNNTYIINPKDKSLINQSINSGGSTVCEAGTYPLRADGKTDHAIAVVFDPDEYLDEVQVEQIREILRIDNGIDYKYVAKPEQMKKLIQVMCNWNDSLLYKDMSYNKKEIYPFVVECLTEMATDLKPRTYNGCLVNYHHVIDQINIIYRNDRHLDQFIDQVLEKMIKCMTQKQIHNIKYYIKSVIWTMFSSYRTEFQNLFLNTYYNRNVN